MLVSRERTLLSRLAPPPFCLTHIYNMVVVITMLAALLCHQHYGYSLSSSSYFIQPLQSSLSRQLVFVCRTNFAEQITSYPHLFVTNTILIACFHYNLIYKYNQNSNSDYMRVRALPYRRSSRRSSRYPFIWCDILISSRYLII